MVEIASLGAVSDAILQEYFFLQKTLEDFNTQVITFKEWSVTVGIAALIAAYTKPVAQAGRIAVIIASCSAIPFWLTETFWKTFQRAYEARLTAIENHCAIDGCNEAAPLQITTSWQQSYHQSPIGTWLDVAFDPHVLFPYIFLLLFGLALACWWPPKSASGGQSKQSNQRNTSKGPSNAEGQTVP